jgi:hypothetical protein
MARSMRSVAAGVFGALLLGVVACGGTTSPTPSEAATPTPAPSVDGLALAAAVVAKLRADPFVTHIEQIADATTTETTADGQTVERPNVQIKSSYDFSGDDMRASMTATSPDSTSQSEMAAVGDTFWTRVNDGEFVVMPRNAETEQALEEMYRTVRITDDPSVLQYVGLETIEGQDLHHLAAAPGQVPYASGTFDALDLYVLADGTPVLVQGVFTNKAPGVVVVGKTAVKYTSFGGPITIEAPTTTP